MDLRCCNVVPKDREEESWRTEDQRVGCFREDDWMDSGDAMHETGHRAEYPPLQD